MSAIEIARDDPFEDARDGWGYEPEKVGTLLRRGLDGAYRVTLRRRATVADTKAFARALFRDVAGREPRRGGPRFTAAEYSLVGSLLELLLCHLLRIETGRGLRVRTAPDSAGEPKPVPGDTRAVVFLQRWFADAV